MPQQYDRRPTALPPEISAPNLIPFIIVVCCVVFLFFLLFLLLILVVVLLLGVVGWRDEEDQLAEDGNCHGQEGGR